nr:hypothetical protein [Tanacetum cinerariifolium]
MHIHIHCCPLSYQASACSLSTLHFLKFPENSFEVLKLLENSMDVLKILENKLKSMKILENKLESMKILENKLESMKILDNKLESLKLQENQPVDGLVPLSIKKFTSENVFARLLKTIAENHREEEDQEGNNSSKITTDFRRERAESRERAKSTAKDSDYEDLVNFDIDDYIARGHGGDGGGDDRPPPYQIPTGCGGCLRNQGKGTRKPNLGGRRAGRMHTRQETQNLGLKAIMDKSGPVPIRFEFGDRETLMPLGDHAAHWANYLGELTQFDLRPHMESDRWPQIHAAIQQYLQKLYNGKKAALKKRYWVTEEDGTYNVARTRRGHPSHIFEMESLATREYPSLIHTFFLTHTIGGVFLNPADKALYDEMLRLQGSGSNTPSGVPYTDDEIMAIVRRGKQLGHISGVGRVLSGHGTVIPSSPPCTHSSDVAKLKKRKKLLTKKMNMFMKLFRSDDKFSQMLTQLESQPEYGGGNGSGGCGDDEPGDDENGDEDGEDEDDS